MCCMIQSRISHAGYGNGIHSSYLILQSRQHNLFSALNPAPWGEPRSAGVSPLPDFFPLQTNDGVKHFFTGTAAFLLWRQQSCRGGYRTSLRV